MPARRDDVGAMAGLLEEMDRFYGAAGAGQPEDRVRQISEALFTDPPAGYALVAWDERQLAGMAAYSFWPSQRSRSGRGPGDTGAVPYDPAIYLGSAAHYRYGRPAYSPDLEAVLTQEAALDGNGRLLDVGCGPGVLTVRLAHLFEQAVGLDPDADMLAEGRRAAGEKRVMNIQWIQGLAEDLPAVAPGPYRLVTFGQSFHWTDEQPVAETVYDMLEPGGALALVVHTVTGRPRPPDPGVPAIPHDEIKALVEKYLGSTRRAGQGTAPVRTHRFEDVLARTRFGLPRQFFIPGIPDLLRDSESVLSGYFSLSSAAPHLFGDRIDDFAGEVRALLSDRSAEGTFWDWPGDTEVVMARKPAEQIAVASPCGGRSR